MCRRFDAHFTNGSSLRGQFQSPRSAIDTPSAYLFYVYSLFLPPEDIHFSASELIQLARTS